MMLKTPEHHPIQTQTSHHSIQPTSTGPNLTTHPTPNPLPTTSEANKLTILMSSDNFDKAF
ncbi:MAG: hypothetical protein AAGJ35_10960, partial [Myxococcota bacterium]